jgi:hypothetical protein
MQPTAAGMFVVDVALAVAGCTPTPLPSSSLPSPAPKWVEPQTVLTKDIQQMRKNACSFIDVVDLMQLVWLKQAENGICPNPPSTLQQSSVDQS